MTTDVADGAVTPRKLWGRKGSAVLFTLFACLAIALCVQIVCAILMCGQRALAEEGRGRRLARSRDEGIAVLRREALDMWGPGSWLEIGSGETETVGRLVDVEGGEGWVLGADVLQDEGVTDLWSSVWLERGRDGVDLPNAVLVAGRIHADSDRVTPWLTREELAEEVVAPEQARIEPVGYVGEQPESLQIGEGCRLAELGETWALDEGWRDLTDGSCRLTARVYVLQGEKGQRVSLPQSLPATSRDSPVLVVVMGGADLDARGAGSLHGVLVVDDGSLVMEGTIVHGAVMVSGDVHFGLTGQVELCSKVLQWATDRSLQRVRAVPGTRREGTG